MGGVLIAILEGLPGERAKVQSEGVGALVGGRCTNHDDGRVGAWWG